MGTITPDKRKYNRLTCKVATLEAELKHAQKLLEAPAKVEWWRRFRGLGAKAAVVVLVVVCFSGCSHPNLADIRNSHPDRMMSSPYPPKKVANCVLHEAKAEARSWGSRSVYDEEIISEQNGIYRLRIIWTHPLMSEVHTYVGEVTIKPDDNGGSLIEYRAIFRFQGPIDKFWEHIKKCADKPPASGQ